LEIGLCRYSQVKTHWARVGLKFNDWWVIRVAIQRHRDIGGDCMKTEAEIGAAEPRNAKDH
jgi:hypothetical protein